MAVLEHYVQALHHPGIDGAGDHIYAGHFNFAYGRVRCGRKLHAMPDGVDEKPVCLMHSKDPRKQSGPLFDAFWREFERILEAAGEGEAHFERFVFPQLDLVGRKFRAICRFNKATFAEGANFSQANFTQHANFGEATFTKDGNFCAANFTQNADFYVTTFAQNANFRQTVFAQNTEQTSAQLPSRRMQTSAE